MDFTPHTDTDVAEMLEAVGLQELGELFAHLPAGALQAEIVVMYWCTR